MGESLPGNGAFEWYGEYSIRVHDESEKPRF
jgi:hypothetical protein